MNNELIQMAKDLSEWMTDQPNFVSVGVGQEHDGPILIVYYDNHLIDPSQVPNGWDRIPIRVSYIGKVEPT